MLKTVRYFFTRIYTIISIVLFIFTYTALKVGAIYYPTDNITNPSCAPGDSGCYVSLLPSQTGNAGKLLVTDGTNPTWSSGLSWDNTNQTLNITGSNSTAVLGSEMITDSNDRDLSSDTGNWTGTNWSVSSGVITHTAGANALTLSSGALSSVPVSGAAYQVTFTINTTTAGSLSTNFGGTLGGTSSTNIGWTTGSNTQTFIIVATNTNSLTFTPDANWVGTIDNVSIKVISTSSSVQIVRNSDQTSAIEMRAGGTGLQNTFIGVNSGFSNTTASLGTFVGNQAGQSVTTGIFNSLFGGGAGMNITTGARNSLFGRYSGVNITTGGSNSAFGDESMRFMTTGNSNTLIGKAAGYRITSGSNNTSLGLNSGFNGSVLMTGDSNTFLGYNTSYTDGTISNSTAIGSNTTISVSNSIVIGATSGSSIANVGIGSNSKLSKLTVTAPADTTNIGGTTDANASTTITGTSTKFLSSFGIGDRISLSSASSTYATVTAIASDTSLTVDTALGNGTSQTINRKKSIFRADDSSNVTKFVIRDDGKVAIGSSIISTPVSSSYPAALTITENQTNSSSFIHQQATNGQTGIMWSRMTTDGSAIGSGSGIGRFQLAASTGSNTLSSFYQWLSAGVTETWSPAATGYQIMFNAVATGTTTLTTVARFTGKGLAIMDGSGSSMPPANLYVQGSGNTSATWTAQFKNLSGNLNSFMIRDDGNIGIGTASPSYKLHVGDGTTAGIIARFQNSTGTCDINPTTTSLSCSSDRTLKTNITNLNNTILNQITSLQPVTYTWINDNTNQQQTGFIAQDVEQIFPSLVSTDPTTNLKSLNYIGLIPYAIEGIKELDIKVNQLSSLDTTLEGSFGYLAKELLGNASNSINDLYAKVIHSDRVETKELCIDDLCITKNQLQQILNQTNQQSVSNTTNSEPIIPEEIIEEPVIINDTPPSENTDILE